MAIVTRRDLGELKEIILPSIRGHFPGAQVEIADISRPQSGNSSETILLGLMVHEKGDSRSENWVLRIQATDYQVYQDPAVARQAQIIDILSRESDVPVPRLIWLEEDPSLLGAPYFVMERVEGAAPPEMYHSAGILAEAKPAAREKMWLSAIEAMARVHRVDPAKVAFLDRPELGATGLDQEIAAWDEYDRWAKTKPHPNLTNGRRWLADHAPRSRPTGLAWGDARLGNVLFRDNRCAALLDWETVSLGGAETDLGWWLYYDWVISDGFSIPRLEGIGGREATIAAWESYMGRKAEAMEWHEVFATWRFAIISERAIALSEAAGQGQNFPITSGDGDPAVVRLGALIA